MKIALLMSMALASNAALGAGIDCAQIEQAAEAKGAFHPPLSGTVTANAKIYAAPDTKCHPEGVLTIGESVVIYVPYKKWLQVIRFGSEGQDELAGWAPESAIKITGTEGPKQ